MLSEQLTSGGKLIEQFLSFRAAQLASGVGVLAADFGFREAVASGDTPTILSAANNHMRRIGADLMLLLDNHGRLLTSTMHGSRCGHGARPAPAHRQRPTWPATGLHVMALAGRPYQFFLAPVRAPDTIGWVAMGFAVDDTLAKRMGELVGTEISLVAAGQRAPPFVASTLGKDERIELATQRFQDVQGERARRVHARLGGVPRRVAAAAVEPGRGRRGGRCGRCTPCSRRIATCGKRCSLIGTIALLLAVGLGLLAGRSASRPIAALVSAARRIEEGRYDAPVAVRGAKDFRQLAATFNAMQTGIAEREARITHLAYHDALTGLPNRAYGESHIDGLLRRTYDYAARAHPHRRSQPSRDQRDARASRRR